jgi:hypothetical protein
MIKGAAICSITKDVFIDVGSVLSILLIALNNPLSTCQSTTAAPSASASLLAFRRTSPRSPIIVSRTTLRLSSSSGKVGTGTSSQRPKAQLRIHHCVCRVLPSELATATVPVPVPVPVGVSVSVIGDGALVPVPEGECARHIKPFTRYTLSFGRSWRAADSVGSSSNGSSTGAACAVVDSSGRRGCR